MVPRLRRLKLFRRLLVFDAKGSQKVPHNAWVRSVAKAVRMEQIAWPKQAFQSTTAAPGSKNSCQLRQSG